MRGQPDLWRVLDMSWLANKVQNRNGTTVLVQYIILYQFNKASAQAPGVDLYAPLPAGGWSVLALQTGGMITDYCLPPSLASAISSAYQRPPFLPGVNQFEATVPQPAGPNCTNDTTAHPLQRCWAHVGRHIDFSGAAAYVDPVGKSLPNGYFSHLVNVLVMCIHMVSEDCVAQYGPLVCMAITLADAEGRNQSPPPPEAASGSPPPLAIGDSGSGAGSPASSGSKAPSNSGSSSSTSAIAAAVGGAVGGAVLIGLVVIAVFKVRRRKHLAEAAEAANGGGDWKGQQGAAAADVEAGSGRSGCLPLCSKKRGGAGPRPGGSEEDSSGSVRGVPSGLAVGAGGASSLRRSEAGASSRHGGGGGTGDGLGSQRGSKAGSGVSSRQAGGGGGGGCNDAVLAVGTKACELDSAGGGGGGDGEDSGPTPTGSLTGGSANVSSHALHLQRQATANSSYAHPATSPAGSSQQQQQQHHHHHHHHHPQRAGSGRDDGSCFSTPGAGTATGSMQLHAAVSSGGGGGGGGGPYSSGTVATSLGGGPQSLGSHISTAMDLSDVMVTRCTPRRPDVQVGPEAADKVTLLPVVRGKGSFGKVYEGMYQGEKVAVKVLSGLPEGDQAETAAAAAARAAGGAAGAPAGPSAERLLFALGQEVEVLGRCRHPNVVRLLAACLQPPRYCLVMELMETSLEVMVNRAPGRLLPLHTVLQISLDIARALEYLHPTVVHRDLKPGNVLINGAATARPIAKLTDFGLSRLRHTVRSTAHPLAGTPAYIAPECYDVNNRTVTHGADMYSFGVLIYTLLAGQEPWRNYSVPAIAYKVAALRERPPLDQLGDRRCPPPLRALIRQCFEHDPRRRPAAAEAAKELGVLEAQATARFLASQAASATSSGGVPASRGRSSTNISSALDGPVTACTATTTNGGGTDSSSNASPGGAAAAAGGMAGSGIRGASGRAAAAALLGNGSSSHRLKVAGVDAGAAAAAGGAAVTAGVAVAPLAAAFGTGHSGALLAAAPPGRIQQANDTASLLCSSQPASGAAGDAAAAVATGALCPGPCAGADDVTLDETHLPPPPSVDPSVQAVLAAFVGSGIGPAAGIAGIAPDVASSGRSVALADSTLSSVELVHAKWGDPMCPSGGPGTRNTTASGTAPAGPGAGRSSAAASQASAAANAGVLASRAASANGHPGVAAAGGASIISDGLALGQSLGLGSDLILGLGPDLMMGGVGIGQGLLGATEDSELSHTELMGQLGVVVLSEAAPDGRAGGGGGGSGGASPNALAAGLVSFPVLPAGVGVLPGSPAIGIGIGTGLGVGGGGSSSYGGGVNPGGGRVSTGGGGGGRSRGGPRSGSGTSLELRRAAVVAAAVAATAGDGGGGGGRSIGGPSVGGGIGAGGGSLEPVSELESDYLSCDGQSEEQTK
ncbi:hypothetical protein HYH02_010483 [Chlamydomonas schloesseri]|uniref:Protein kinase domain-containing protein n=1 Tax=Chlamydomonas schloesseri TaxID=2026947 RepID=A0A835TJX4_9CHLO|nr:hypothetical protein HYH02_010483 [Chlamydomonas schloesseri]|eukprot:KAG2439851.1 hypothetical protein HYH02_010483 [Chlamydomonas schloesseri]